MAKFSRMNSENLQILTLQTKERSVSFMDFNHLPVGLIMGMTKKQNALDAYSKLTEAEKEQVINECRDAKSKAEMDRIINRLSGNWY